MAPSALQETSASGHSEEDQHEDCTEQTPLIANDSLTVPGQQQAVVDIKSTINLQQHSDAAPPVSSKQELSGQCRICLEEDSLSNLESPCGCTGTQQYAHKDCIQKWVNEKHNSQCEICQKQYEGSYTVPPPPPPAAGEPLHVVAPLGGLYLTMEDARVPEHLLNDVYDEWDDHRQPTVSWCFSFMMFLLFMMFLHSTMTVTVPDSGSSTSSVPGMPDASPAIDPSGAGSDGSSALPAAGLAAGASLLFLWLFTKLFLVVLPVVVVMRVFARAQEQAEAAAAVGGSVPGLDAPAAAGSSSSSAARHIMARLAGRGENGSSLTDLELEVMQARRAALSRFGGREASLVWGSPAAAAAAVAAEEGRRPGDAHQQHQEEQRMIAAMRAMVRAAIINTHRELMERRRRAAAAAAGGGGVDNGDSHEAGPAAVQREQQGRV